MREKTMADKAYDAVYGKGGALERLKSGEKIDFRDAAIGATVGYGISEHLKKKEKTETEPAPSTKSKKSKSITLKPGMVVSYYSGGFFNKWDTGLIRDIIRDKGFSNGYKIVVLGMDGKTHDINGYEILEVLGKDFLPKNKEFVEALKNPHPPSVNSKSWKIALFLAVFLGAYGLDRFYLGYKKIGLLKLFTLGCLGILWIHDAYRIATKTGFASKTEWR